MQYDLYILAYFNDGHPKLFCLVPPLIEPTFVYMHEHQFKHK